MRRTTLASIAALAATLLISATAPARAAGGLTGIDVMTSTVFQEEQSSFSGLAIRFRLSDPRLVENIEFLPTVEYWRNSSTVDAFDLRAVRRDATLSGDVRWLFPGESWRIYAGTGVAVHFLSNEVESPALTGDDSLTKGGLTLLSGVSFGSKAKLGNFLEVKGHLVGGFRQLKINMGLSWNK